MRKFFKDWKNTIVVGLIIFVSALVLRLCSLTLLPVFADEAIYIRWSQVMFAESTLRFLPLSDGKQPLFMWVLMFLVNRFSDPLFIGRLISVATGMGTLASVFALSYLLFKSKRISLIASLFWAVSPFSVFFDRMALVDSMLAMFGMCTLFWGILTVKTKRLDIAMLTGFALGFAVLTKSSALFFAALLPITWMLSDWPKRKKDRMVHLVKLSSLFLATYIIAFGMYSIQGLGPNFHLLSSRTGDYLFPLSQLWTNPKDPFIFHIRDILGWFWSLGSETILVLFVLGMFLNFNKYRREILVLSIWILFPLFFQSMYVKAFTARYILFSLPPLFVLAASSFLVKKENYKKALFLVLSIFLVHAFWVDYLLLTDLEKVPLTRGERIGYLEGWTAGTGIKEVAEFVKSEHNLDPKTKIVVGTEGYFGTLPDGLQMYLEGVPNVIVIGVDLEISYIHQSLKESKEAGNKTYLLVNSTRLKENAKNLGLELLAAYPKAIRPDGSRETLLFFEVTERVLSGS